MIARFMNDGLCAYTLPRITICVSKVTCYNIYRQTILMGCPLICSLILGLLANKFSISVTELILWAMNSLWLSLLLDITFKMFLFKPLRCWIHLKTNIHSHNYFMSVLSFVSYISLVFRWCFVLRHFSAVSYFCSRHLLLQQVSNKLLTYPRNEPTKHVIFYSFMS